MSFHPFNYVSLEDLANKEPSLPICEATHLLAKPYEYKHLRFANRLAIQPMEGADGEADGSPSVLTNRRYLRFFEGGAGLIWVEACAVDPKGKANPRQLAITEDNVSSYQTHLSQWKQAAYDQTGNIPYVVLQLTHSGRYSKPDLPRPIVTRRHPLLDKTHLDYHVITDAELDALQEAFVRAAKLAYRAGFDAVDIKACHGYLLAELLSAFDREGKYGGTYENRSRMLIETISKIKKAVPGLEVTTRLGVYDAVEGGFGVDKQDPTRYDLTEPVLLIQDLARLGVSMVNITAGNPYYNPHINRPYHQGPYAPDLTAMQSLMQMLTMTKAIKATTDICVVGSALSYLRHYAPYVAAKAIDEHYFDIAGFGRMAFAYPSFATDIIKQEKMEAKESCIACSKCTEMMRMGGVSGCPVKDRLYVGIYKELKGKHPDFSMVSNQRKNHL